MYFRIKWLPNAASPTNIGDFGVCMQAFTSSQDILGFVGTGWYGEGQQVVQIGSETAYPAGEYYQETTINAAMLALINASGWGLNVKFANYIGGNTNTNDSITLANFGYIDLTAAGIVPVGVT